MLVSGYNNIIVLPNCTMLYYVFSGPLSLRAYVPEIKFNNNASSATEDAVSDEAVHRLVSMLTHPQPQRRVTCSRKCHR